MPQNWSHFAIIEQIGSGTFGTVYRATDTNLQLEVALKLLWPANPESPIDPSRALGEARLLAKVRHHNVVTVYGTDQLDGRVGIWMEFVKGRTLASLLSANGPLSAKEAALILSRFADNLDSIGGTLPLAVQELKAVEPVYVVRWRMKLN